MAVLTDSSLYVSNLGQEHLGHATIETVVATGTQSSVPTQKWPKSAIVHDEVWDTLDDRVLLSYLNSPIESQKGDAFQALYNRYHLDTWRFICSRVSEEEDAKDIFCEVWTVACTRLPTFTWRETKSANPVKSWLLTTTWNFLQEHFRKREREATVMVSFETVLTFIESRLHGTQDGFASECVLGDEQEEEQQEEAVQAEADLLLQRAMKNLPAQTQQILSLIYYSEKNATEVGQMLGLKPGTVRQQHKRGLEKLRKIFECYEQAEKGGYTNKQQCEQNGGSHV